jgi:hypothetical protein
MTDEALSNLQPRFNRLHVKNLQKKPLCSGLAGSGGRRVLGMLKRHEVEIFDPHPLSNLGLDCGKNAR